MEMEKLREDFYKHKLVAILRSVPQDCVGKTCEALYKGGIRFFEICFNQESDNIAEEFKAQFMAAKEAVGADAHIGAGTVLTKEQLDQLYSLGGEMCVAPNTNPELIQQAKKYNMLAIPGAKTPSEIVSAYEAGADCVKLYIVEEPKEVKMLRGPLGHIPMQITCNVSPETIPLFLNAGIKAFGTRAMLPADKIAAGDYSGITELAKQFCSVVCQ